MPAPPYARALVSRNGGATQTGGIVAQASDVIQLSPESTVGWKTWRWEIYSYPPSWSAPTGWTLDPTTGIIFSIALTPQSFTLPALPTGFGKWLFALRINEALTNDELDEPPLADRTTGLSVLSTNGLRDTGALEEKQFDAIAAFIGDIQRNWRVIDAIVTGAIPTGSVTPGPADFVLVTNHAGTASVFALLTNNNVDPSAAIAGTKIAPNFGSQPVTTTGPASLGSTTVTALSIGSLTGVLHASGGTVSASAVNLTTEVTGTLPIGSGGTGQTSFASGLLTRNGTALSSTQSPTITGTFTTNALTVSGLGTGPLVATAGVVSVGPTGASTQNYINVADRTALANFDTASLLDGSDARVRSPSMRYTLVKSDTTTPDGAAFIAAKSGGGTVGNWILDD